MKSIPRTRAAGPTPPAVPPPARWLALGDSYTVGEGVGAEASWPARVARRLAAAGLALAPLRIVARTGWTTDELLAGMEAEGVWPARERWDLVSLLVGVNDQYRGRTLPELAGAYARCLERALALTGGRSERVLAVSVPDWGVTPFARGRDREAIARDIDAVNALERGQVERAGARWCDVTALSRAHGGRPGFLAADLLHPGAQAHAAWAEAVAPLAEAALAGGPARGLDRTGTAAAPPAHPRRGARS